MQSLHLLVMDSRPLLYLQLFHQSLRQFPEEWQCAFKSQA
jgi:hypothetical protein